MNVEQLSKLLESIQGHLRAFDSKAQIVLGLDSLLAGFVGAELAKGCDLAAWHFEGDLIALLMLSIISISLAATSAIFAIMTIVPRTELKQPKSHFFFCHLVELYGRNYHKAADSLIALSGERIQKELATQIQANAVIGDVKSKRSNWSLYLMTASLIVYIVTLVPFCRIAYRSSTSSTVQHLAATHLASPR